MPSSLTVNLSSALVYSTRPPVSVSGTGPAYVRRHARVFSGACSSRRYQSPHAALVLSGLAEAVSADFLSLPPFNALFRQCADDSLLRHRCDSICRGCGILTACPSCLAWRRTLRSRLTLNRLALFRNPWSFGEGVSRPLCRYLYLHLLFRSLQKVSRPSFTGSGMLPYQCLSNRHSTSSAPDLCPIIIHAGPLD